MEVRGSFPSEGRERGSTPDWVSQAWLSHHPDSPTCDVQGFSCRQWESSWKASVCAVLPM